MLSKKRAVIQHGVTVATLPSVGISRLIVPLRNKPRGSKIRSGRNVPEIRPDGMANNPKEVAVVDEAGTKVLSYRQAGCD